MSIQCFKLDYLQQFNRNIFIIKRFGKHETIYTYDEIIKTTQNCILQLLQQEFVGGSGIGLSLKQNTPSTCVLILSILNIDCHFCPLYESDVDGIDTNTIQKWKEKFLKKNITHLITDNKKLLNFNLNAIKIEIFNEIFYLYKFDTIGMTKTSPRWCYSITTTGSTGTPKLVHVPYECIEKNILALSERLKISSADVIFLCAPITFDPFVIEFFLALKNGATILITSNTERLNSNKLLDILFPQDYDKAKVSVLQMTPSIFRLFGVHNIRHIILAENSPLRILLLGGEPFPEVSELQTWLPTQTSTNKIPRLFNIYGITEVSCWSLIYEYQAAQCQYETKLPLGDAIDDTSLMRIMGANKKVVQFAGEGELELGSAVRKCYISEKDNKPSNDDETILYRQTGDLVQRNENGDIFYLSRLNRIVKRFGKRLCLDALAVKIENILKSVFDLHCSCACLCDDMTTLICCIAIDNHSIDKIAINNEIIKNLTSFEKPDRIEYINNLMLNAHGKIDYHGLTKEMNTKNENSSGVEAFQDFLCDVLNIDLEVIGEKISPFDPKRPKLSTIMDESFIYAGGHSCQALSLSITVASNFKSSTDERKLLEMLLDERVTLRNILDFIRSAEHMDTINLFKSSSTIMMNTFQLLWEYNFLKCIDSSPIIIDKRYICVGSHSHLLCVLDAANEGQVMSSIELPDRIECRVQVFSKNVAIVGCYDGFAYAFDIFKSKIKWSIKVGGLIKATPIVLENGLIIIGNYSKKFNLICFDSKTKSNIWLRKIGKKSIIATPAIINNGEAVLVCTLDGTCASLNCTDGVIKWSICLDSPIFSSPIAIFDQRFALIASVKGVVYLIDTENGNVLTHYEVDGSIFSSFLIQPHTNDGILIIFGCFDKHIYCLHLPTCDDKRNEMKFQFLWRTRLLDNIYATPIIVKLKNQISAIVGCAINGQLMLLNIFNGGIMSIYNMPGPVFSTPCALENTIYVGCRNNFLHAFSIQ